MEAVLWLRSQGQLAGAGSKRRKSLASTHIPASESAELIPEGATAQTGSIGKQVQDLCLRLGFTNPAFELVPLSGSFYNVHATFTDKDVRYEPKLAGAVAPIHNVFSKKAAKDECWNALLTVLQDIQRSRGG